MEIAINLAELSRILGDSKPAAGLYIVATPLGNALDMTLRAIAILRGADVIAAEDTRVTQKLLAIYGIKTPLISYHDHNEREMAKRLAHNISAGKSVALVSDAGTPLISDPGYRLLQSCIAEQLPIHVVPGPSAVISSIAVSGLPPLPFQFCGFIPPRGRKNKLAELKSIPATHVFFESALRLVELLHDIESVMGNVPTSIARINQKIRRGQARPHIRANRSLHQKPAARRGDRNDFNRRCRRRKWVQPHGRHAARIIAANEFEKGGGANG